MYGVHGSEIVSVGLDGVGLGVGVVGGVVSVPLSSSPAPATGGIGISRFLRCCVGNHLDSSFSFGVDAAGGGGHEEAEESNHCEESHPN